jgi:hypothetical protein
MDELVKLVAQKTGISEENARTAVKVVLGFLQERLPAPVAGQIDALLEGGGGAPDLGSVAQGLGLFGKKG